MRKIQFYVLLFVSLMIMTIGLIACTNDEAITDNANEKRALLVENQKKAIHMQKIFIKVISVLENQ